MRTRPFLLLSLLALSAVTAQANLVANPSFETNNVTDGLFDHVHYGSQIGNSAAPWSFGDQAFIASSNTGYDIKSPAEDGRFSAGMQLDPTTAPQSIRQDLAVVPNQTYSLSFYATSGSRFFVPGTLSLPGTSFTPFHVSGDLDSNGSSVWTLYTGTFTATSSTFPLDFVESYDPSEGNGTTEVQIDNVSVEAVPEPASMAALGLGTLAMIRRRKGGRQ